MNLLILESPNKAQTVSGYLSSLEGEWKVIATKGHFKNLKENSIAVKKIGGDYVGEFVIENKQIFQTLREEIPKAQQVYIATDDDREGESIADDIITEFNLQKHQYKRVVFQELTKKKITEVLLDAKNNEGVNEHLVDARYSRRLIDRLVGYKLTPLLKHIFAQDKTVDISGIGRVSYAALAILVSREKEITLFEPYKYRKIAVTYWTKEGEIFCTSEKRFIEGEEDTEFFTAVKEIRNNEHIITEYNTEFIDIAPPKPVIFSTLISNMFYLYKYTSDKTSQIAQKLFEGIDIGGERKGLITYHRTDSYRLSEEVAIEAANLIPYIVLNTEDGPLGYEYTITEQRTYKNKKGAQDAHEAIRPVHLTEEYAPHRLKRYLSEEEFRVYDYIYKITLSTFMANSTYIETKIVTECGDLKFKSETKEQIFDGWEIIGKHYVPFFKKFDKFMKNPPMLYVNDTIEVKDISDWSRAAKQPERYSEGRLIETLTSKGVGRPSTLPVIIPELLKKKYITSNRGMLKCEHTAMKIVDWAEKEAEWIVNINHAREFEEALSLIENDEENKNEIIEKYDKLIQDIYKKYDFVDIEEYKKERPSQEQIAMMDKLKAKGVEVPQKAYTLKIEASKYLKKYFDSQKICKCKVCSNGDIVEYETSFNCNNKECDFILWKSTVANFIKNFHLELNQEEFALELLKKKQVKVENLKGKNAYFNANVFIEYDEKYKYTLKWKIAKKS